MGSRSWRLPLQSRGEHILIQYVAPVTYQGVGVSRQPLIYTTLGIERHITVASSIRGRGVPLGVTILDEAAWRLGRALVNEQPNGDADARPMSVIGAKADIARTCGHVRY